MAASEPSRTARVRARPASDEPKTMVLVLSGTITRADIPALCERAHRLLERTKEESIVCDVDDVLDPDAVTVDVLSRLQLAARRLGREVRVLRAPRELCRLIDLMGLTGVLPGSAVETRGQTEQREQPGGVQEERDPGDPVP